MLTVDLESPEPLEDQLRRGIREAIARGEVRPGDQLPAVRQLAGDLGVHFNTVARAYRRLRDEGLVAVGQGRRVTVREPPEAPAQQCESRVRAKLREAMTEARLGRLSWKRLREIVQAEIRTWPEGPGGDS